MIRTNFLCPTALSADMPKRFAGDISLSVFLLEVLKKGLIPHQGVDWEQVCKMCL